MTRRSVEHRIFLTRRKRRTQRKTTCEDGGWKKNGEFVSLLPKGGRNRYGVKSCSCKRTWIQLDSAKILRNNNANHRATPKSEPGRTVGLVHPQSTAFNSSQFK